MSVASSGVGRGWYGGPCHAGVCDGSGYMSPWAAKCEERLQDLLAKQKGRDQKIEYGMYTRVCACCTVKADRWQGPREGLLIMYVS